MIKLKFRTFADALDGVLARDYLGIKKHQSIVNSFGYYIDGIADAIGFLFFVLGVQIYLKKQSKFKDYNYSALPIIVSNHFLILN